MDELASDIHWLFNTGWPFMGAGVLTFLFGLSQWKANNLEEYWLYGVAYMIIVAIVSVIGGAAMALYRLFAASA